MLPDKIGIGPGLKLTKDAPVRYYKSGKITLGPGDTFIIIING